MLKIVWLPWKFMRLHVAISFEKFFFLPLQRAAGRKESDNRNDDDDDKEK